MHDSAGKEYILPNTGADVKNHSTHARNRQGQNSIPYRIPVIIRGISCFTGFHQAFQFRLFRHFCHPDRNLHPSCFLDIIHKHKNRFTPIESSIADKLFLHGQKPGGTISQYRIFFPNADHFPVKCQKILIFPSPWIGSPVIRIRKSA